jgi:poly-beta-1,6-N-acetyl-D-glucosamine synthase
MTKYVIITPVRDEEEFIAATIDVVSRQTILPKEWVIVNDGSSDRTGEIIDRYAAKFPWIRAVHRENRGFRKSGAGVVEAFNDGHNALVSDDWEFIVKLDGDLTFSPDYFEQCFARFASEPKLGVGGGEIYHDLDGRITLEATPRFHVRGATKIYRKECWDTIGGLWMAPGWDTIDEVKANMLGWTTHSFKELRLHHHRFTGTADGLVANRVKHGIACYVTGYHPLFLAASCFRRLVQKPYVVGSFAVLAGFLKGYWKKLPRVDDPHLIRYVRGQQLRRLCSLETIWK